MARRRKSTGADVFFDLTSKLPWWLCLAIAVIGYFVLHKYATAPVPQSVPGKVPDFMSAVMLKGLATGGQYIVPILFVAAAIVSLIRTKFGKADDELVPRTQATARPASKASAPGLGSPRFQCNK